MEHLLKFSSILVISMYANHLSANRANGPEPVNVATDPPSVFESQVSDYLRLFAYQQTHDFSLLFTRGDPANLNRLDLRAEPSLLKAGEDFIPHANNDTFYNAAALFLEDGPVVLNVATPADDRFVSIQLVDDRNVNYHNIIAPEGEYTLYYGEPLKRVWGEAIKVPSKFSVLLVRVEVKDKNDPVDMKAAKAVYQGITLSGIRPGSYPGRDLLRSFPEEVTAEAHRRMDEAFKSVSFARMVAGPGMEPGKDVAYLYHSAATKHGWGAPDPKHSAYENFYFDAIGKELRGSNGVYTVTTEEPPVDAFWSVTVYNTDRSSHLHPNSENKYHINDTTAARNEDGTVSFTFREECGQSDLNCLEVPAGRFDVVTRYFLPREEIISGQWSFPEIRLQERPNFLLE